MKILGSIAGGLAVAGVAAGTVVVTTSCSDAYKKINITIDDKTATGSVYILTVKNIAAGVTYNWTFAAYDLKTDEVLSVTQSATALGNWTYSYPDGNVGNTILQLREPTGVQLTDECKFVVDITAVDGGTLYVGQAIIDYNPTR
ncbi:MAG: hypothetical protein LBS76_00810 [Mycoplasmataceae bacterium]|nr:hypothetical protein [Mycoplasmataceae bacterium]